MSRIEFRNDADFDPMRTAVGVFAEHGDRAVQIAAMRATRYARQRDTPGFRHWAQVITELNAMIPVLWRKARKQ